MEFVISIRLLHKKRLLERSPVKLINLTNYLKKLKPISPQLINPTLI